MRLILVTFGTRGDCQPLIALGVGLQNAGHDVLLLGERAAAGLAAAHGLPFAALAGDIQATLAPGGALHKLLTEGGNAAQVGKAFARIAQESGAEWMEQLRDAARETGKTADGIANGIIFSGLCAYVALSVAEYLNIPVVAAGLWPISPTREFPSPLFPQRRLPGWANLASHHFVDWLLWRLFRPSLNAARRKICGQEPHKKMWRGYPVLYGMSAHLAPRPRDWPPDWQVCGAWTLPPETDWQPPPELEAFLAAGTPPLYVGFGSMTGFDREKMCAALIEAAAGRRVLFYPGWSGIDPAALPENFHTITTTTAGVPHEWLFPRVAAAIHHGGAGTTHAAARAGIPSIVLPFGGDQPFWAARLAALGVAPEPVAGQRIDARRLAAMIAFTERPEVREKAAALGQAVRAERGIENAVARIEEICGKNGRRR